MQMSIAEYATLTGLSVNEVRLAVENKMLNSIANDYSISVVYDKAADIFKSFVTRPEFQSECAKTMKWFKRHAGKRIKIVNKITIYEKDYGRKRKFYVARTPDDFQLLFSTYRQAYEYAQHNTEYLQRRSGASAIVGTQSITFTVDELDLLLAYLPLNPATTRLRKKLLMNKKKFLMTKN